MAWCDKGLRIDARQKKRTLAKTAEAIMMKNETNNTSEFLLFASPTSLC